MKTNTKKIAGIGLFTAIVVVLQLLGSFIRFGTFSISLVLIPIVVGAALYGVGAGAWLGLVFGVVVLLQPDTALFLGINTFGTILTVLLKGCFAGTLSGLVYKLVSKKNRVAGVIIAAVVCPIVNTGIFLLGCRLFFFDWILENANGANAFIFMITTFVGLNFLFELATNIVLSPTIVKIIEIGQKSINSKKSVQLEDSDETE